MKKCVSCGASFTSAAWICPACGHVPKQHGGHPLFAPQLSRETKGYDAQRHQIVAQTEDRHFWFGARARAILWAFGKYFRDSKSYLEVGCGSGFLLSKLLQAHPDKRVVGSELLVSGLNLARQRVPQIELLQMDVLNIPYKAEFGVIGAYDVIEHIDDDRAALQQFSAALISQGGLLLTVPQHPWLWSRHDERARHVRRYVASDLRAKVEDAGFRVERMTSLYASTLPLMGLSRWISRFGRDDAEPEFSIPELINRPLDLLLRGETSLIRWGLDLPVGGSILLVARKRS